MTADRAMRVAIVAGEQVVANNRAFAAAGGFQLGSGAR